MTQSPFPPAPDQPAPAPYGAAPYGAAPNGAAPSGPPVPAYAGAPVGYGAPGPVGKIRGTGMCILLAIVTFGIYQLIWFYSVHDEMKRHTGRGLGGGVALLLAFFVGVVMPYLTSAEAGGLYESKGKAKPVSGATGLWYFPGVFILVGPIIWFVKTNGAINDYWRSQGAQG
jgi:hypothetical protein